MGEVYRARDTRLERSVALKVLPKELSDDADLKARFTREARAISALNHPHICALYDVGSEDGVDYLVMELLEGETLADRIAKGPLPTEQVLRIGVEIAEALDRAHRLGVVHRDLKPGNVMLTRSGVKLLDFGLAKLREKDVEPALSHLPTRLASKPLTERGTVLGTFQYMSPEQLEGKDVDARSDIFALGAVLYEMSTAKRAFNGTSQASLIAAILSAEPPPISTVQKMSPSALDRLVKTCLAKDPDERWQSAHDVSAQLRGIAEGGSSVGTPAVVVAKRKSRERIAWALAAVLALALGVSLAAFRRPAPTLGAVRAALVLPDSALFEGAATVPELSPDGRTVAFSTLADDPSPIWILSLASDEARPLAGTERGAYAFFSPDGRSLAFFADKKLKRIDLAGGSPVTICETEEAEARGGTWGPDGTILFAGGRKSPILRVPASGGTPVQVTTIDKKRGDNSHRWPRFLPDGRRFFYWATPNQTESAHDAIFVASLDGGEPHVLLEGVTNGLVAGGRLLTMRHTSAWDSRLYARPFDAAKARVVGEPVPLADPVGAGFGVSRAMFTASDSEIVYLEPRGTTPSEAAWIDRKGTRVGTLGEPALFRSGRISPDGARVAFEIQDPATAAPAVYISDAAGTRRTRASFGAAASFSPIWSPDGKRLAFISCKRPTDCSFVLRDAGGQGSEQTIPAGELAKGGGGLEDWSPDGKEVLFSYWNSVTGNGDVWAIPVTGDQKPFPLLDSPADEGSPHFSPDGRFLAYESNETGRFEIFVKPMSGQGKWQVSAGGGNSPRWRRDGKELFFISADRRLLSTNVTTAPGFEAMTPKPVFERRLGNVFRYYDVAPAGDRFLMDDPPPEARKPRLRIVSNWQALLAR
jgi:Tol biopolymer transport system component